MRSYLKTNLGIVFLMMALCQLFTFCTRKLQPGITGSVPGFSDVFPSDSIHDPLSSDKYLGIKEQSVKRMHNTIDSSVNKFRDTVSFADRIIASAMKYLGVPHCMGGISTRCIDCSGLIMVVFDEFGIELPHNAQEQSKYGTIIKEKKDLNKGDLLFFHGSYRTDRYITHSAIYIGNGKFIHTSSGNGVSITSLDDSWWKGKYVFARRILPR